MNVKNTTTNKLINNKFALGVFIIVCLLVSSRISFFDSHKLAFLGIKMKKLYQFLYEYLLTNKINQIPTIS